MPPDPTSPPSRDDWGFLVPALEQWADVRVLGFGRLELCVGSGAARVCRELRLTPDEWDDIEAVMCAGDWQSAADGIKEQWDRASPEQRYLVYNQYCVVPSDSAPTLRR